MAGSVYPYQLTDCVWSVPLQAHDKTVHSAQLQTFSAMDKAAGFLWYVKYSVHETFQFHQGIIHRYGEDIFIQITFNPGLVVWRWWLPVTPDFLSLNVFECSAKFLNNGIPPFFMLLLRCSDLTGIPVLDNSVLCPLLFFVWRFCSLRYDNKPKDMSCCLVCQ